MVWYCFMPWVTATISAFPSASLPFCLLFHSFIQRLKLTVSECCHVSSLIRLGMGLVDTCTQQCNVHNREKLHLRRHRVWGGSSTDLDWIKLLWNGILRSHYSTVYSITGMSVFLEPFRFLFKQQQKKNTLTCCLKMWFFPYLITQRLLLLLNSSWLF